MTRPVLFVHGWGFDARLWDAVAALLPGRALFRAEAGYLGAVPHWPEVPPETLLVGHSLGALSVLGRMGKACAGVLLINGFTRFAAANDFPGVADRVLGRMQRDLASSPRRVVDAFRERCGTAATCRDATLSVAHLAAGLEQLRGEDRRPALVRTALHVVALAAPDDAIVSPEHTRACFRREELHWSEGGGHLLPLTRATWCAEAIERFP